MKKLTNILTAILLITGISTATTIHVPGDYVTIQEGINAASNGDTILVADGTYAENTLEISGKYVYLFSENGAESTVITGSNSYRVLYIENNQNQETIVNGFTLSDGRPGSDNHASAIKVGSGLASFENLIIENNGGGSGNTVAFGSGIDSTQFIDCIIRNNSVEGYAGLRESTNIRCVLYGNSGWNNTCVLLSGKSINCVVVGNGGGAGNPWTSSGLSEGSAINCIFWGNSAQNIYNAESVTYSNVQGGYSGEGNIDADPFFVDAANSDFTLQSTSPCIDTGDPDLDGDGITWEADPDDQDPDGTRMDMGAYYYDQGPPPESTNYSLSFDGGDDYVTMGDVLDMSGSFSVSAWVISDGSFSTIVSKRAHPDNYYGYLLHLENTNKFHFEIQEGHSGNGVIADAELTINEWVHLVGVFDAGNNLKLYKNGSLASTTNTSISSLSNNSADFFISSLETTGSGSWGGKIDEVAMWNIALDSTQIQTTMNNGLSGDETGLVGYWNFNEGTGSTLTDLTANGNDGTIYGATWNDDGAPVNPTSIASLTVGEIESFIFPEFFGDTVSVPVDIELIGIDLLSAEIRFSGFQDDLEFLEVNTDSTLAGDADWTIVVNEQDDLLITVSYGSTTITESGTLFNLEFYVSDSLDTMFIPIDITDVQLNELVESVEVISGGVGVNHLLFGDVTMNDDVSAYDASMVLRYLVGLETFGHYQELAANVTLDETISALDASVIAQYVAELINELPFTDSTALAGTGDFGVDDGVFASGELLEIPIELYIGENLLSFEMDIIFDSEILSFEEINFSNEVSDFMIEQNVEDGLIRMAGSGSTPDGSEGIFATLQLFVSNDFEGESFDITISEYKVNENNPVFDITATFTNVMDISDDLLPDKYSLHQNYPNPFNPVTTIRYDLPDISNVRLVIYDLLGREVITLLNKKEDAGFKSVLWSGLDAKGSPVSAGVYIYHLSAGDYSMTRKMVLLK